MSTSISALSPHAFAGPLWVTVAYFVVYYLLMANLLVVKRRLRRAYRARGETFDRYFNTDREMLAADRYVGNMLEHMPAFLALLWLNAVFVGPGAATVAGGAYALSRAIYPFVMGSRLGRGVPSRIFFVTVIGYVVIGYFTARLVVALLGGGS
jgi:hypothetical protein